MSNYRRHNPNWKPVLVDPSDVASALLMTLRMRSLPEWSLRARHETRGRPQRRTIEGSLASLLVAIRTEHRAQVTVVDRVQQGFPQPVRDALGMPTHRPPELVQEAQHAQHRRYSAPQESLGRHFESLNRQLEASPFFGHYLTDEERAENYEWQHRVYDDVVAGWLPPLPAPDLLTTDATGIRSFARPWKDPDFAAIHQTPTLRDPASRIYGASGTILTGANLPGHPQYPPVAFGFRLPLPPEKDDLDLVALELLDSCWLGRGNPPVPVVADAYYPHKTDWSLNLAHRGCGMIGDLQEQDRGRKPDVMGAALIDACLHCPFARYREDLPSPKQEGQALRDYQAANRYRANFSCQVISESRETITLICPAQAGLVRCARWPKTDRLGDRFPRVDHPPPMNVVGPEVCRGPITVPRTTRWIRKTWMPYYFGGDEWRAYWSAGRPRAEGEFGYLFGSNGLDAGVGVTNWVGQARTGLVYACALAVQNLDLLRAWWVTTTARDTMPEPYRSALEADPLLWPTERQAALLPQLLAGVAHRGS